MTIHFGQGPPPAFVLFVPIVFFVASAAGTSERRAGAGGVSAGVRNLLVARLAAPL